MKAHQKWCQKEFKPFPSHYFKCQAQIVPPLPRCSDRNSLGWWICLQAEKLGNPELLRERKRDDRWHENTPTKPWETIPSARYGIINMHDSDRVTRSVPSSGHIGPTDECCHLQVENSGRQNPQLMYIDIILFTLCGDDGVFLCRICMCPCGFHPTVQRHTTRLIVLKDLTLKILPINMQK